MPQRSVQGLLHPQRAQAPLRLLVHHNERVPAIEGHSLSVLSFNIDAHPSSIRVPIQHSLQEAPAHALPLPDRQYVEPGQNNTSGFNSRAKACPMSWPKCSATRNDAAAGKPICSTNASIACHRPVISVTFSTPSRGSYVSCQVSTRTRRVPSASWRTAGRIKTSESIALQLQHAPYAVLDRVQISRRQLAAVPGQPALVDRPHLIAHRNTPLPC